MGFTEVYSLLITVATWGMLILGTAYLIVRWRWPHLLEVEPESVNSYDDDYVADGEGAPRVTDAAVCPFEQAEQPRPVQPEQPRTEGAEGELSISDLQTLDRLGALFAAKALSSEAAAIEVFFAPVKRGGSRRYLQLRDHLRAAALRHGWKPAEPAPPAGHTPIAGRPVPPGVEFAE